MPAVVRPYMTAGVALMGAGVITAAQITPPLSDDETRVVEAAVSLAAAVACSGYVTEGCDIWATPTYTPVARDESGSAANIAANLLNAVISIPRAFVDALNELSYGLEVTGNWWVYTPTNVLGTDPADPPKETALVNLAIPFKPLSHVVGEHLSWWARANLPMDAGCTGTVEPTCTDPAAILSTMFLAPGWVLTEGYQFPELNNPVSDAEGAVGEPIEGSVGAEVPWSGVSVKLDPDDAVNSVMNYLFADPAVNTPKTVTLTEIGATLTRLGKALDLAFNPFVPMSFLLKGWPYTVLTPLFTPFVPIFCPTCNPEDPGLPPVTQRAAASTTVLARAEVDEADVFEPSAQSAVLDTVPAPVAVASAATVQTADGAVADSAGARDSAELDALAAVAAAGEMTEESTAEVAAETVAELNATDATAEDVPTASEATENSPKRNVSPRRGLSTADDSAGTARGDAGAADSGDQAGE